MTVSDVPADYDAAGQRAKGKGGTAYNASMGGKGQTTTVSKVVGGTVAASSTSSSITTKPVPTATVKRATSGSSSSTKGSGSSSVASTLKKTTIEEKPSTSVAVNNSSSLQQDLDQANASLAELQVEMSGVEKERDFYFDKLRDIEMMLQDLEDNGKGNELTASIFKILYATAEGFQPAGDEEQSGGLNTSKEPEEEAQEEETF